MAPRIWASWPLGSDVVERLREVPLAVDGGLDLQHRDYRLGEEVLHPADLEHGRVVGLVHHDIKLSALPPERVDDESCGDAERGRDELLDERGEDLLSRSPALAGVLDLLCQLQPTASLSRERPQDRQGDWDVWHWRSLAGAQWRLLPDRGLRGQPASRRPE